MIKFQQDAIDTMEHFRNYTAENINKLQAGFIPAFLNISWYKSESYYHNNKECISRDAYEVVLKVDGIRNNLFNEELDYTYLDSMINSLNNNKVQPFMLFINGKFIKWSNIKIVREYDDVWLVVDNIDRDTVSTVDILYLPFIIHYDEYRAYNTNNTLLFRFDEDGTEGGNDIFISTPETHIRALDYKSNGIAVIDKLIGVDKHIKLSSDNIITFNNNILNRTYDIIVRNLSLLTINKGVALNNLTYKIFYSTYSNGNIANIVPFDGTDYLRKVQKGTITNKRLEIDKLETDLNMMFSENKSYELNVQYNIKAMFKYNQGLFDELYKAKSNVYTLTKSGKALKGMSIDGVVRLNKWFSENDCYILIFLNGYLYNAYNTIAYSLNSVSFNIDINVIRDSDIFEIVYFKDVYNYPIYSNISQGEFVSPKFHEYDELKVISEYDEINKTNTPGVYHYNKFNLNSNNTITFEDSTLYNKNLYILSDRQFKYHREEVATTSNIFNPPDYFKTCINPNKYLVFVNSRLVNKINYKLTLDDEVYNSISFTFKRNINIGDVLEIFYLPDEIDYINSGFKLVMDRCKFISKSDNQSEFRITYPFDRYIKNKDGCVVSVGGTIISPTRYTIDGSKLAFIDGTKIKKGRVVQLIFLYNLFKADYAVVSKKTHIKMVTKKVTAINDNQRVFDLPIANIETGFLVCYNSVYIDPSRYTVAAGKLTFGGTASLNTNEELTFIYGYNEYEDLYVKLKNRSSVIFNKNVSYVFLPTLRTDNFFMSVNTVFIDPERYEIDDSSLKLTFLDPKDYLNTGDRVTIIYIDDELGSDGFKRYNKLFTYTYYAEEPNQMIFEMPYMYDDCLFDKDSFIVSLGSTFIDSDRCEIDNINCTLKLLYPEDALQPDEGISYIFAARILSEDGLFGSPYELAIINLLTRQYITVSDKENTFRLPIPEVSIKDKFIVSINGVFIDSQRYDINGDKLKLKDPYDYPEKGIIINFIYAYNRVDKRYISILNKTYENNIDKASIFDLPTKYKDNFLVSTNSSFINTDRYSSSYGALVLDEEADYLIPGDKLTYLYFPEDLNSEGDLRRNKFRMYTTYVTDKTQVEYDIPYMNSVSIYSEDSFILLVNGVIYDKQLYYVANNRLYLKTPLDYATGITFVYSTSILADDEMFGESLERDVIKFEDKIVTIKSDDQLTFSIPLPDRDKDCPFYLVYGSVLIDNSVYTIDRIANTITIVEPTAITLVKGKELIFTFIHSDFIVVHKEIVKVKVDKNNQKMFTPRRVDENYPTTVVKELVFKGATLLDDSTYYKGNRHRYVFDRKTSFKIGQELTFMYLYLGDDENNPRILPESGYIYIDRENAKHNLNKDLYFLFINGKKIDKSNIIDICDNLVRVERFPGTRYNVSMLSFTRMIPEFETLKYKRSSLTEVLDILMADDLDLILNRFNRMIGPLEEESIDKIVEVTNDNVAGDNIIVPVGTGGTITNGAQMKTLGINTGNNSVTEVVYEYNNNSISKVSSKDIASPPGFTFASRMIVAGTNVIVINNTYTNSGIDRIVDLTIKDSAGVYSVSTVLDNTDPNTMEQYWVAGYSYKNETILIYILKRCEDSNGIWMEYIELAINGTNCVSNTVAKVGYKYPASDIMDMYNGLTFGNLFDGTYINTFTDNKIKVKPIITVHNIMSGGTLIAKGIEASYDIYYDGIKEATFDTGIKADPSTFSKYMNTMFPDRVTAYLYASNCTIFRISANKYILINRKDPLIGMSSIRIIENGTVLNMINTEYDFYFTKLSSFISK